MNWSIIYFSFTRTPPHTASAITQPAHSSHAASRLTHCSIQPPRLQRLPSPHLPRTAFLITHRLPQHTVPTQPYRLQADCPHMASITHTIFLNTHSPFTAHWSRQFKGWTRNSHNWEFVFKNSIFHSDSTKWKLRPTLCSSWTKPGFHWAEFFPRAKSFAWF